MSILWQYVNYEKGYCPLGDEVALPTGIEEKVPTTFLGGEGATSSTFLRGDRVWAEIPSITAGGTVVSEISFGQLASAGFSNSYSRSDHTHGTPENPVPTHALLNNNVHGVSSLGFEDKENKNQNNGYCGLNVHSRVNPKRLGIGSTGDGIKVLFDNQTFKALGGISSLVVPSHPISNIEQTVISYKIPEKYLQVGTTILIRASGVRTSTAINNCKFRMRVGIDYLVGNVVSLVTANTTNSGVDIPFTLQMWTTVRSIGRLGNALGGGIVNSSGFNPIITSIGHVTRPVDINTEIANILELTCQTSLTSANFTFHNAFIEFVVP